MNDLIQKARANRVVALANVTQRSRRVETPLMFIHSGHALR